MRIAIDIRHLCAKNPTGVGYYSRELVSRLIAYKDIQWTLFASGSARALRELPDVFLKEASHITLHRHREPNRFLNAKLYTGRALLDDLVASPVDAWFFPNLDFIRTEKPYAMTVHDLSFAFLPECYSRKARVWHRAVEPERLYTDARHLIAVSQSTTTDLSSVYNIRAQKISTIPLAANESFNPNVLPSDRHTLLRYGIKGKYLLSLSTIEPRKNHVGIVLAYTAWRAQAKERIPLIIAGLRGHKAGATFRAIRRSPYAKDIHHIGYVAGADRPALMRHASALLFPSLYEGFGLPLREAVQSGTPVLTSNNSGMIEHKEPHVLHVSPWHVHEIASGIQSVLSLSRPKKQTNTHMTWDEVAARTHEVLNREFYA